MEKNKTAYFEELVELMRRLRAPDGCMWDRQQTHESLKPYLIEEAYEVLEAIDGKDMEQIREELGDLLFQVIFHAQVAAERGDFDIYDVVQQVCQKMTRRHPHVFGEVQVSSTQEILANWEQIKQADRKAGEKSVLSGVPIQLPALLQAHRIQEKAARVGFDHQSAEQAFLKLQEELGEFEAAVRQQDQANMEAEMGDLLFSLVNVGRFLEVNPEEALRKTIMKFISRFRYIEEQAALAGRQLKDMTLDEMDELWEQAKKL